VANTNLTNTNLTVKVRLRQWPWALATLAIMAVLVGACSWVVLCT